MSKTIIDWCGNWDETAPLIEEAVKKGKILEINLPLGEWEKLRSSQGELTRRLSKLARSRLQLLYTHEDRHYLFVGDGEFH